MKEREIEYYVIGRGFSAPLEFIVVVKNMAHALKQCSRKSLYMGAD